MDTTIDTLSIEIENNSDGSTSKIDNLTKSLQKLADILDVTEKRLDSLSSKIKNFSCDKVVQSFQTTSQSANNVTKTLEKASTSLKEYQKAQSSLGTINVSQVTPQKSNDSLNTGGTPVNSISSKSTSLVPNLMPTSFSEINSALSSTNAIISKFGNTGSASVKKVADPLKEVDSNAKNSKNSFLNLISSLTGFNANSSKTIQLVNTIKKSMIGAFGGATTALMSKVSSKMVSGFKTGTKAVSKLFISTFTPITGIFKNIGNSAKKIFNSTNVGIAVSKLRGYSLALLGVRSAFTATRKAIGEYMAYDTELSEQLTNNWTLLGSIFSPILQKLINLFSRLVAYIGTLIKAFTGFDIVANVNSKNLNGVAESAKAAANELGSLAKFDDLNVVTFPDNSGAGAGGTENAGVQLPDVDTTWLDKLIDKIKNNDWYGLGMEIARKFNQALASINFDVIMEKATQWGKNMGDLLNGLTDGTDWALLGQSISNGLNTVMAFVNTFFDTYNFEKLGTSLANGLNNMVSTLDWAGLGNFISNSLSSLVSTGFTFVMDFDFSGLGEGFASSLNAIFDNVDFGKMSTTISTGLQGVLQTIESTINNTDWSSIGGKISDFLNNMDLGGLSSSLSSSFISAMNGLGDLLSNVDWGAIGEQIAQFWLNIDWFGIVTQTLQLIGTIIISLGELLWGFVKSLVTSIWDKFITWLEGTELGSAMLNIFSEGWEALKKVFDLFEPYVTLVFDGIKNSIKFVWDTVVLIFTTAWNLIKIVWDTVKGYFSTLWNSIALIFSAVKDVLSGDFQGAWDSIKKIWSGVKDFFKRVWDNVKGVFSTVVSFFGNTFSNAITAIKNKFSSIASFFSSIFSKIKSIFKKIGTTVGNAIGDSFANVVNTIIGFAEKIVNKFIKAINKAVGVINKIPGVEISKLSEISIPKLATGTNRIEQEGLYHLHKDEAVVPKKYNPAVNGEVYEEKNQQLINKFDEMISVIQSLEFTNNINIGNKRLYSGTVNYVNRQNNIYGENVVDV